MFRRILVTGPAGFVGSNVAVMLKQTFEDLVVLGLNNLHRRGSELSFARLAASGVRFQHGDIRCTEDLEALPDFDLMIDCAAEPSVHAGVGQSPRYALNNNLQETLHCIDLAARRGAAILFLSTSPVYPVASLNSLPFSEQPIRFGWDPVASVPGRHRPRGAHRVRAGHLPERRADQLDRLPQGVRRLPVAPDADARNDRPRHRHLVGSHSEELQSILG